MATREKKVLIQDVSRADAEQAFADYNTCYSQLEIQNGKMNAELTAVKEKYESKINELQKQKDAHFEVLQTYAENNPDEFKDKKSMDFTHGTIGFRTGTPKLSLLKGYKWPAVLDLVKKHLKKYIRTKEEVDKESLLSDRNSIDLSSVGLKMEQDETFYVAPALEAVNN